MDLPAREPLLRALIDICGPDFARRARRSDAVAGRPASFVAVPATGDAVTDTMRLAADRGLAVVPRGGGSKLDWGSPPPGVDLLLDTRRLAGIRHHDVALMTAEISAGTPVRAAQAALALRGQRLAVDPPSPAATLGGMLALNETGPLRHRFGTAADQVNHLTYTTRDGRQQTSGGSGPAEIDGVILSAHVRLEPVPAARRWVAVPVTTPRDIHDLVRETLTLRLAPSAIEIDLPAAPQPGALAVLLEGDPPEVADRAARLQGALAAPAAPSPMPPLWWGRYPFGGSDVALRIEVPTADLQAAVFALRDVAGTPVPVRGAAGRGVVHAALPAALGWQRTERVLDALRGVLLARGGRCMAIAAPPEISAELDMASRQDLF
ncbi:glycolate oxidase FAD binding subunit [Couchioplanes caeruleus]|uniref:Glycolate oxidase FAD binding subunit n=2 Tax=Couchioplanes caeruleus TaxID=56438 RepID=A0A3N1GKL3_9ACTN|nr:glycolate oxidase FAD binding subunit [Couchioplanes caeruleus]